MSDDDVLQFPGRKKDSPEGPLKIVAVDYRACQHRRTLVDHREAEVTCADCGAKLNPMWVLKMLSEEDSRLRWEWAQLRASLELMRAKTKTKCRHCGKLTPIPMDVSSYKQHELARTLKFEPRSED